MELLSVFVRYLGTDLHQMWAVQVMLTIMILVLVGWTDRPVAG